MIDYEIPAVEEYRALRKEIIERIKLQAQLEIFSLSAAGVVWGVAMFGRPGVSSLWIGICAGLLILACASLNSYESVAIFRASAYIAAKFETHPNSKLSWESFVVARKDHLLKPLGVNRHVRYYVLLMMVNLLIAMGRSAMDPKIWKNWTNAVVLATILVFISFAMCFPVHEMRKAFKAKAKQIECWQSKFTEIAPGGGDADDPQNNSADNEKPPGSRLNNKL